MQFMLRISLNVTLYSYVCMLVKCAARIQNCCLPFRSQAGLVLGWITVHGYTILVFKQTTQAHSAWPSLHG